VADVWVDGIRRVADGRLVDHEPGRHGRGQPPLATKAGLERYSRLAVHRG
jgi:hypothetical protein